MDYRTYKLIIKGLLGTQELPKEILVYSHNQSILDINAQQMCLYRDRSEGNELVQLKRVTHLYELITLKKLTPELFRILVED